MKNFGFIRIAVGTPQVLVANCDFNTKEIISLAKEASEQKVSIVVFPELCVSGYTCGDLFQQPTLLVSVEANMIRIREELKSYNVVAIVGLPIPINSKLYNAAAVIYKGKIIGLVPKVYLPNYKEFHEQRWFAPAQELIQDSVYYAGQDIPIGENLIFELDGVKFGVEICEDLWTPLPPSTLLALHGAELLFNLSASNGTAGKHRYRKELVGHQSARCVAGYAYASVGCGESSTDSVFPGAGLIAENGKIIAEAEHYRLDSHLIITEINVEGLQTSRMSNTSFSNTRHNFEIKKSYKTLQLEGEIEEFGELSKKISSTPFILLDEILMNERCEEIFAAQVAGLVKRLSHINTKDAVIGVSGGLDSTLALLVIVAAFDKLKLSRKSIHGITMPGFGTTDRTYNNALALMKSLDISTKEISIVKSVEQHFKDIEHNINKHDVTYENAQARERTQILMDYANKVNGIVVGTGDLSELALGWCTYNGDHMSMYAVNSGVPKTLVRTLTKWIADNRVEELAKPTLYDIIDTPISPELLPTDNEGKMAQITESLVGPYELHDFFLFNVVHCTNSPAKIYYLAKNAFDGIYDNQTILKWMRVFYWRFFSQQFKRSCMPDGPKIGAVNLSPRGDWNMPSDACVSLWMKELDGLL